jgi:hypothetical protein
MDMRLGACVMVLFCFALNTSSVAQDKKSVPDECASDEECETGNCVQLKEEDKKVCLYCKQDDYENYWSEVQNNCKNIDEIGRYADLKSELQKHANKMGEYNLVYLNYRRDINRNCLNARLTRENACWKDQIDSGHKDQIDQLIEALNAVDALISESIRLGKAYKVDDDQFDELLQHEEENCRDLHTDFDWLSSLREDEKADCTRISTVADKAGDCREVRKSIVDVFQDRASPERMDALKEAEAAESEAKRILEIRDADKENLCL